MFSRERYQILYGVLELTPGVEIFVLSFTVENNGLLFASVTQLGMFLFSEACEKSIPNTWKWRLRELILYIGLFPKVIPLKLNGYCYIG